MANTTQSYHLLGQSALDSKLVFNNVDSFFDYVNSNSETFAFNFYKGMLVYFQEEEKFYIWETPYSKFYKENSKLLDQNFIYPLNSVYNDLDYSGIAFNLIEFPYQKENLGEWDDSTGQKTLEIQIYHNSVVNPFKVSEFLAKWPNADRLAFIAGSLNGLKIYGQSVSLYQEIPVEDFSQLVYTIINGNNGFIQDIRIAVLEVGEVLEEPGQDNEVDGNSFKDLKIVYDELEMVNKNSMYFKPVGDSFEVHVLDRHGIKRKFKEVSSVGKTFAADMTSGSQSINHGLNTKDVIIQAFDTTNGKSIDVTAYRSTVNTVHITLNTPYSNPVRILISKV